MWLRTDGGERQLRVSNINELSRSLLSTGFPSDRRTNPDNNLPEFNALERRTHGVRRQGSAALRAGLGGGRDCGGLLASSAEAVGCCTRLAPGGGGRRASH